MIVRVVVLSVLVGALLAGTAGAAGNPEQKCQADRAKAAGKYAKCVQDSLAKEYLGSLTVFMSAEKLGKCVTKYAATWPKLQAKASGTGATCDNARFDSSVPGTVIDRLTALQWEQKGNLDSTVNLADPHDADDTYTWTDPGDLDYVDADGTAFTTFLTALNSGGCFAGQCDWRLPTLAELLSIKQPAYPICTMGPCIDPVFGPTVLGYWSATTYSVAPPFACYVTFDDGLGLFIGKQAGLSVRGVRSGL